MIPWDNYRFLLALAQGRTMAAAARSLGTDVATVSRRIEKLNELYGRPVFLKRLDGWTLAPGFDALVETLEEFSENLTAQHNNLVHGHEQQRSTVVIGSPPVIASSVLLPALDERHGAPRNVDFTFTPRLFEDGLGDCDLVIRYGRPEAGRIVTRRAGALSFRLYGLDRAAEANRWIGLTQAHDPHGPMQLGFQRFFKAPSLRVGQFEHLAEAMLSTGLPGPLPDVLAGRIPLLHPLPDSDSHQAEFWLLYHESRSQDMVVRGSAEWIVRAFRMADQAARLDISAKARLRT